MKAFLAYMLILGIVATGTTEIIKRYTDDEDSETVNMMRSRARRIDEQLGMEPGRE